MKEIRPFIPRNKPKFWIVGILAGLAGLVSALLAFGAAWLGLPLIKAIFMFAFFVCWFTFAVSWLGCAAGMLSGRYKALTEKPWREQVW